MSTMITDAAVDAAAQLIPDDVPFTRGHIHDALEAALPHLAAPEAGNAVSVSERERFEWWANKEYHVSEDEELNFSHIEVAAAYKGWQAALAARQPAGEVVCDKHCQNGRADVCLASQRDGIICPEDSCDIDDGIRHNHAAPPAQQSAQVYLGQFRQAVLDQFDLARQGETWSRHSRIKMQAAEAERDRLLALIDAQAK